MANPRCPLHLRLPSKRPRVTSPLSTSRRSFHNFPARQRLGAFTYAQEWQTGHYSFNKSHAPTYPVAAARTDELLQNWATQFKRRDRGAISTSTTSDDGAGGNAAASSTADARAKIARNAVIAQRRKTNRYLISHATAKDFGNRVEVTAFVYDGVTIAEEEKEKKRLEKLGVKPGQAGGKAGGQTRRPRATVGAGSAAARTRTLGFGGRRRIGGAMGARPGGAGVGMRRLQLGKGVAVAGRADGLRFSRPGIGGASSGPPRAG